MIYKFTLSLSIFFCSLNFLGCASMYSKKTLEPIKTENWIVASKPEDPCDEPYSFESQCGLLEIRLFEVLIKCKQTFVGPLIPIFPVFLFNPSSTLGKDLDNTDENIFLKIGIKNFPTSINLEENNLSIFRQNKENINIHIISDLKQGKNSEWRFWTVELDNKVRDGQEILIEFNFPNFSCKNSTITLKRQKGMKFGFPQRMGLYQ